MKNFQRSTVASLCGLLSLWLMYGAALAQTPKPSPTASAAERYGEITGRVLDAEGRGVTGAMVRAFTVGRRAGLAPGATTGLDGRFRFSDLAAGVYQLSVNAAGYVQPFNEVTRNARYRLGADATLQLVKGGVITGQVIDARGAPVVAVRVRALPVADENLGIGIGFAETDDRGIYRVYGLRAGHYVMAVGGASGSWGESNGTEPFLTVYHPATTTVDTAKVISIQTDSEKEGVDITYETVPGRLVSGKLLNAANQFGYNVILTAWPDATSRYYSYVNGSEMEEKPFVVKGLPDGDYLLTAQTNNFGSGPTALASRRVKVQGADVTGLELTLAPLASLTGRVVNEPIAWPAPCQTRPALAWDEIGLTLQRYAANRSEVQKAEPFTRAETAVDGRGAFTALDLSGGKYLLQVQWPAAEWYLRGVAGPKGKPPAPAQNSASPTPAASVALVAQSPLITLAAGAENNGWTLTFALGAASLSGRVMIAKDAPVSPEMRVYLVPAEPENAANLLRYQEIAVTAEGLFKAQNLAPGRYWLLAQANVKEKPASPFYDDAERAKLRRAAETAKNVLDLTPCQKMADYELQTK